ncbi:hypothetical protein [Pedobacter alpinus]|uniref:Uncharacterized protein n=1 Tax=Pedobacter alpinus TaxID=1590643 RepID=A0ABW5TWR8_9SPHI
MRERILSGWTFKRGLYVTLGIIVIIQSVTQHQWFGVVLGSYFAAMGLFSFGCAGGNCFSGYCSTKTPKYNKQEIEDIRFEEVKSK